MTKILLAIVWAGSAQAQEMPAEAQRVLELATGKVLNTARKLPRYTCQERIEREYLSPSKVLPQDESTWERSASI
jgi:hypothetical protein